MTEQLEIPIPDTRYTRIVSNPTYKITLHDNWMEIIYKYSYQKYREADNQGLGVVEEVSSTLEEYIVSRDNIAIVSLIKSYDEEVFYVGLDAQNLFYDIQINFKELKDAREFKTKLTDWWLKKRK